MSPTISTRRETRNAAGLPFLSMRARAVVGVALIVVCNFSAFLYTASQLRSGVDITSPVAYVPFVPLVALAAAAQRWRPRSGESRVQAHRSADWIVFAGLAVLALVVGRGVPRVFTTETLTWRADLAALPLIAATIVVGLFGMRMLWRLRTVLWFLTLMSPAIYRPIVAPIRTFTSWSTGWAVAGVSNLLPFVAGTKAVADGRQVIISATSGPVTLEVAEVCAGNGAVLAGIFVSASMWMLCEGSRRAKWKWSAWCVTICWLGNLVRLAALFAATSIMGEGAATGWFHELAGLVGLVLALIVSLSLASRFGLEPRARVTRRPDEVRSTDTAEQSAAGVTHRAGFPIPRLGVSALVVLGAFVVTMAAVSEVATNSFDLMRGNSDVATVSASTVLAEWTVTPPTGDLSVVVGENVPWASQFFGRDARWDTFLARSSTDAAIIGIDVISSSDPTRFDTYGLAACFGFHGWRMELNRVVTMQGDRRAEQIVYSVRGAAAQREANTPGGEDRTVAVMSWRQRGTDGRVQRITLQQPQPNGAWSLDGLTQLADQLSSEMDQRSSP